MEKLETPIDFNIAISLVLFFTKIVSPEMMLKAATMIIKDNIMNITFLSTFKAENNGLFKSDQVNIYSSVKSTLVFHDKSQFCQVYINKPLEIIFFF